MTPFWKKRTIFIVKAEVFWKFQENLKKNMQFFFWTSSISKEHGPLNSKIYPTNRKYHLDSPNLNLMF